MRVYARDARARLEPRLVVPVEPRPDDRSVAKAIARREAARGSRAIAPADGTRALEIGPIRSCAAAVIGCPGRLREPGFRALEEATQPRVGVCR